MIDFKRMNQKSVASAFGVSRESIRQWVKSKMPMNGDGSYSLPDCIRWREDRARDEVVDPDTGANSPALERWREHRARLAQLDVAEREGELIRVDEVKAQWVARVHEVSTGLEALTRRLTNLLPGDPRTIEAVVSKEVFRLKDAYARRGRYCGDETDDQ